MVHGSWFMVGGWLLLIVLAPHAAASDDVPPASRQKLENLFAKVADNLWTESDKYWHEGRLDVCVGIHRLIVEIDPTFVEAYDIAAWLLSSDGRDAEAEALYRRGVAANPNRWEPAFDFGMFYYQKKDFNNAEKCLAQSTTKSAPTYVWKMLAHSQEKQGKYGPALETWVKVKSLDPNDPVVDNAIARNKSLLSR